jgi:hypothetical protein
MRRGEDPLDASFAGLQGPRPRPRDLENFDRDIASHSGPRGTRVKKETGNNLDPPYPAPPLG